MSSNGVLITACIRPFRSLKSMGTKQALAMATKTLGHCLCLAITYLSVLIMGLIFLFVVREAMPFFRQYGIASFLLTNDWYTHAEPPRFGALAAIVGSLYVTITALMIAVPFGILAAIFISEMASPSIRSIAKPVLELLATIPSVAYGFFAITIFAPWLQRHLGCLTGTNALNASVVLAIMASPTIISISEDAISAIARDLREAAYSLGSTRAETILKVVVPAAKKGILAAVILGMMRAIGETMVVWMASGNATQIPQPWWDLTQSIRTITATIAAEMGETAKGSLHYHALFALGALLLFITVVLNLASELFISKAKIRPSRQ